MVTHSPFRTVADIGHGSDTIDLHWPVDGRVAGWGLDQEEMEEMTMNAETPTIKPVEGQIKQTIQDINKRLADPDMKRSINRAVREGYTEVVDILVEGRESYDGIDKLTTVQGRAIAVLGVDYLKGECSKEVLVGVPLKR